MISRLGENSGSQVLLDRNKLRRSVLQLDDRIIFKSYFSKRLYLFWDVSSSSYVLFGFIGVRMTPCFEVVQLFEGARRQNTIIVLLVNHWIAALSQTFDRFLSVFLKAGKTNHWKLFFFLVFSGWSDIKFQVIFAYCIFTKNIKGKWYWRRRRICVAWDVVWEKILIHTLRPQAYDVKLTPPNGKQTLFPRSSISMDLYNRAQRGKRFCLLAPLIHNNKFIDGKC